jgi:hypothetical protein
VGCCVAPLIQVVKILLESGASSESIQSRFHGEAEAIEVLDDVAEVGVAVVKLPAG